MSNMMSLAALFGPQQPARLCWKSSEITELDAIGTDEATCGVTGHAVIVHKGCPSDRDDPCDPGVRIGCCVLA